MTFQNCSRLAVIIVSFVLLSPASYAETRSGLVIGISDYRNYPDGERLKYANADAIRFSQLLKTQEAGSAIVKLMVNEEATRNAIWSAVDDLKNGSPPDTLFVFFSGHAVLDPRTRNLYLMPFDGDKRHLGGTGVPWTDFIRNLKAINAKHLVIFLDACHSGAAILEKGGETESSLAGLKDVFGMLNEGSAGSILLFASAGVDESSWEDDERGSGIFSGVLIRGLAGAADELDGNHDGKVDAAELKSYLDREVPQRASALHKPKQTTYVSPLNNSDFFLTFVPREAFNLEQQPPSGKQGFDMGSIAKLRGTNPELALMVHMSAIRGNLITQGSSARMFVDDLWESLDAIRVRKMGSIGFLPGLERIIGSSISDDGALFVACVEPLNLLVVDLNKSEKLSDLPLSFPSGLNRDSVDSCTISIAADNRYVAASVATDSGTSFVALRSLSAAAQPKFSTDGYDCAVFLDGFLALASGTKLTLISTSTWAEFVSATVSEPIIRLSGESRSNMFAVVHERKTEAYEVNRNATSISPVIAASGTCESTTDLIICEKDGIWSIAGRRGYMGSAESRCAGNMCKLFPSGTNSKVTGWSMMFQSATEPNTVRFISSNSVVSTPVQCPERVLNGRLMLDGSVVLIGQAGGIYRFSSQRYADCCTLETGHEPLHVAAGRNGATAILTIENGSGYAEIFRGSVLLKKIPIGGAEWVHKMVWANSNRILAFAGDRRVRLIDLAKPSRAGEDIPRDLDCGLPITFDSTDGNIVCTVGNLLQLRNITTGAVEREFVGHAAPVYAVMIRDSTIIAAGAHSRRGQTEVTVWRASSGSMIAQKLCTYLGSDGLKPLAFIRQGSYFVQLDTPTAVTVRDSLTCEGRTQDYWGSVNIQSSPETDWVVLGAKEGNAIDVYYPFERGGYRFHLDLPLSDYSLSPDGDLIVLIGGRVLRLPIAHERLLELALKQISRNFTSQECQEVFKTADCSAILHVHLQ